MLKYGLFWVPWVTVYHPIFALWAINNRYRPKQNKPTSPSAWYEQLTKSASLQQSYVTDPSITKPTSSTALYSATHTCHISPKTRSNNIRWHLFGSKIKNEIKNHTLYISLIMLTCTNLHHSSFISLSFFFFCCCNFWCFEDKYWLNWRYNVFY